MKIAKKALSVFLALLMVFTACAAGLPGMVALAAEGDSKYTKAEVITLVNAAVANGYSAKSSGNATNITGDNGNVLAAADAIFDYAVKTYREGRKAESAYNSGDTLCEKFISDFSSSFSGTALNAMKALATDVLNPNGTTVYGYSKRTQLSDTYTHTETGRLSKPEPLAAVGTDVTTNSAIPASKFKSNPPYNVTKTVAIDINLDDYLCGFDTIEDIPSSFITSVSYTYAHTTGKYAYVTATNKGGSFLNYKTTTNITTYTWNYMSAKPVRVVTKNTTAKKYLKSIDKFFNADRLALTKADLLEMSLADLEYLNTQAGSFRTMMNENFSAATLTHFGFAPSKINELIDNINFAYRAVAGKAAIDTLNAYIGTEYNKESYAEMSSLYSKVSSAYDIVFSFKQDVIDYIVGDGGYSEQYADALALKTTAQAYIATLKDIMTEQRLEELVNSMMAKYDAYYSLLDKENIAVPGDEEITHLVSQVASWNGILATYTGYGYYRTYYTTEIEAKWNDFTTKLNEVAQVRGLKADYKDFYDWFYYLLYTTEISDASDEQLMSIYEDTEKRLGELRAKYNEIVSKYGNYVIADKIFTIKYEGSDYLLQTLIENSKTAGFAAIKTELINRAKNDIDSVMVYSGVTQVNFENFADIKSTLSHYGYDLYDYVTGGNREKTNWLSSDYVTKHSMVQTLLDRYHAFTKTNGKASYDELKKNFGFADANGLYAIRYAGSQFIEVDGEDENGNPITVTEQIGYPNDIARDGADDNYYVDEELLVGTVKKIDNFITSRDFGALAGFVNVETEEATDLKTYINQMLAEMLYTDEMLNTLVGAVYPMLVDLINTELIGAISNLSDPPAQPNITGANAAINVGAMSDDLKGSGIANLFIDDAKYNGKQYQNYLYKAFADLGLYIYPTTLADSLAISNPSFYGKDTDMYKALKAADRDWSQLVCEDDPNTLNVDETKVLEFEWGVYDQDSFLDAIACVLDPLLPLLQSLLAGAAYSETASNAAYAVVDKIKYSIFTVEDVAAYGDIVLGIQPLNLYSDLIVPLFRVLGVENIPTLKPTCGADDVVNAIFGTLLKRVDQILDNPLDSILTILPNLVYWLSMDSVQEIIDSLVLNLNMAFELEIDSSNSGTLATILGFVNIEGLINDMLKFDLSLDIGDMLDLYDLLGFEITNINEVIEFVIPMLGDMLKTDGEAEPEAALDIKLPPIKQQEIILCSDWTTRADGSVNLVTNKGELMYWFLDYIVAAIADGTLINALLGDTEMDPTIKTILDRVVSQISGNPKGALAAVIELLNPVTYDLKEMDWIEQGDWNYNGIEGANNMSIVYLYYGNDWTQDDANYLVENIDSVAAAVLDMTGMEIDDLGAYLQDTVNGFFTNDNITALVKMLGGLGDSPSAAMLDIVANQVGIDISSWFNAFGYLFPAGTWAEDAEVIGPDSLLYVNNFGIEGIANEDGTISWFFNRMPLVDGDGYTFINILSRLLGSAEMLIKFLFAGEDIAAFEDLITVKGYETYDTTFGLLLTMLGVENIPTQADFNTDAMGSFNNMLYALLDWFYALTDSDNMIAQLLELIPDVFYFIESNGLSTFLHNLLMPVWVLVDTVRPVLDVDVNGLLSVIVSEILNYGTLNIDVILEYLIHGIYMKDDVDFVYYAIDINNLRLSDIIVLADTYFGSSLATSGLVEIGIKGLCSGVETVENTTVGTISSTTVTAADAITIIVTALIDCLGYPAKDAQYTNGDVIFSKLAELTGSDVVADIYSILVEIIAGIDYEYETPDWGYMFESSDLFSLTLPEQSVVYLEYTTDWTPEAAQSVYGILDKVVDMILPEVLEEGSTIATLINGVLEDNVYSDEILNTVVELIVNAISALDATLRDTIDVVIDTDIASWFTMCEYSEAEEKYLCTKEWGIAEASDKKAAFVAALKEVLAPANELLAWLFFGDDYAFFTGSEKDEDGNYVYNDLITIAGGEAYAYGIAPIFEALGCTMPAAETFYDPQTNTYNVGDAVEAIFNMLLALVDEISAKPVEKVLDILPNLIYFVNADGLSVSVNNILAPINTILEKVSDLTGGVLVNTLLEDLIGFDITDLSTEVLLGLAADAGVNLSPEMLSIICELYVGNLTEFTSANGNKAYRLNVEGYEGDVLTLVLSIALDLFNLNAELFSGLLGEEIYNTVYNLIKGAAAEFEYREMNWAYMYDGEDAADKLAENNLPDRTGGAYEIYTQYQNNWNEATAEELDEILDKLVDAITKAARGSDSSLGQILDNAISGGLYQDSILNSLIGMVVELLVDYEDIVKGAGAVLGAGGISAWFDYCEITTDANGDPVVKCTKNWGIDSAATNDGKREAFINGFVTALEPAYRLLAWLLFEEDYTFFNGTTGKPLITITGGEGYDNAIVPLLEGVSATMGEGTYVDGKSAIKSAEDFYVDGELDMEQAVRDVFTAVTDWLYDICGDLSNQSEDGTLGSMLEKLPNFIYFVNADGLKVVVNNLLVPVNYLLDALAPLGVKLDINELIGMDITNFDFYAIFDLLEDLLGLYFPDYCQEFLATLYIGQVVEYTSANGDAAYYMTYSEEETRSDMITCIISFVVDAFEDPRNDDVLIGWMGADIYNSIINILNITAAKAMQEFGWLYTEYADTDEVFSATDSSLRYEHAYDEIWEEYMAEYIADNLVDFTTKIVALLGLEINGYQIKSVEDLVNAYLNGDLYTQATADSILDFFKNLTDLFGDYAEIGDMAIGILDNAIGTSMGEWAAMEVTVEDGNRDSFVAALKEILAPIVPLLDVLLCGEDLTFFYSYADGSEQITIPGSEGYAYGIIPLFEALGCTMLTPAEFYALEDDAKIGAILDSLLDRVDTIMLDPVNEIFAMLPAIIYFINSNGLDTSVRNIVNTVDTVLAALEPVLGAPDLMSLLGIDLAEYDFAYIAEVLAGAITDATGMEAEALIVDAVAELTMGKVISYESANGETYYTMVYANDEQLKDMVTILLRLAVDFISTAENADAIAALLVNNTENEEAAKSVKTFISLVIQGLGVKPATSGSMATIYYIFYGLKQGVDVIYDDYYDSWIALMDLFKEDERPIVDKLASLIGGILGDFAGFENGSEVDNCKCSCHSKNAVVSLIHTIINIIRRILGQTEYRYCYCGVDHWDFAAKSTYNK